MTYDKCPICKTTLKSKDYSGEMYVERYEWCVDGCGLYTSEEWCGHEKIGLGNTELIYHYYDSKTRRDKNNYIYNKVVKRLQKRIKKGESSR